MNPPSAPIQPLDLLKSYPAFAFMRLAPSVSFAWANASIALFFAALLLLAATLDGTLVLDGRSTGLLEHPGAMIFLLGHAFLPPLLFRTAANFFKLPETTGHILTNTYLDDHFGKDLKWFADTVWRSNNKGRVIYHVLLSIGIAAYVWNSIQNSSPQAWVHKDFWDSIYHPFGFWSTRIYRFYLCAFLVPAVVHLQVALTMAVSRVLRNAIDDGHLILKPYHPDGAGGARIFLDSTLHALPVIVVTSSLLTLSAFIVHGKYDVTTVGGLCLTCGLFLFAYFLPATTLRNAIRAEKRRQIREIAKLQDKLYSSIDSASDKPSAIQEIAEVISGLSDLRKNVRAISEWPQLARVAQTMSLAAASLLPSAWASLKEKAGAYIGSVLANF